MGNFFDKLLKFWTKDNLSHKKVKIKYIEQTIAELRNIEIQPEDYKGEDKDAIEIWQVFFLTKK